MEYGGRPPSMKLKDMNHPITGNVTLAEMILWVKRIKEAIERGYAIKPDGTTVKLDAENGIDILGAIIESSVLSPNRQYYGNLHNYGHILISVVHDPDGRFKAAQGVMGSAETAMRDPIFFRWHKFINSIFQSFKNTLPFYEDKDIAWNDIQIESLALLSDRSNDNEVNILYTYFQDKVINVARGLDFRMKDDYVLVKFQYMDHDHFIYRFKVTNLSNKAVEGTVRIFMAPKHNEFKEIPKDESFRLMLFEVDKFRVNMRPGSNQFTRSSNFSSITIPSDRTWNEVTSDRSHIVPNDTNFCGCGWPNHLLIPRGTEKGLEFVVFAMITNWKDDQVSQSHVRRSCNDAVSMCGVFGENFPDKPAMGFPLDRPFPIDEDFPWSRNFFKRSNMILQEIRIIHLAKNQSVPKTS